MLKIAALIYLSTGLVATVWFWWEVRKAPTYDSRERPISTHVPDYIPEEWDA